MPFTWLKQIWEPTTFETLPWLQPHAEQSLSMGERDKKKLANNFTLKANALIRDYIVLIYLFTYTNNFTHKCSTREEWKVSRFLKPLTRIAIRGQGTQQIKNNLEISVIAHPQQFESFVTFLQPFSLSFFFFQAETSLLKGEFREGNKRNGRWAKKFCLFYCLVRYIK